MSDTATGRNNPWLDLVRSAAIILVLLRHGERALLDAAGEPAQSLLQTIFMNGWVGVDLFFVLSGYLIAAHLMRAGIGSSNFTVWRYLAMRALRILPAYYAVLALLIAGAFPLFSVSPQLLPVRIGYHLVFLQDYLPSNINVVFWSLAVEEKFYLLAPVLIFALLHVKAGWLRIALLVVCFVLPIGMRSTAFVSLDEPLGYSEFWQKFRSPFHMSLEGLIVGVGIAIAQHAGLVRQSRKIGLAILGAGSASLVAWLASYDFMATIDLDDATLQPAFIAILAGTITLGAVQLAGSPMPITRFFQFLARMSYSLYLVHYPLIPLARAVTTALGDLAFWLCYVGVSLGAALLIHLAVERPFLRIKDRLAQRNTTQTTRIASLSCNPVE